jgi:hypothetical protein
MTRFHGLDSNTNHYLGPYCNNFSYGKPEPLLNDEIPFEWNEKKDKKTVDLNTKNN